MKGVLTVDLTLQSGALIHKCGTNVQLLGDNLRSERGRGAVLREEGIDTLTFF